MNPRRDAPCPCGSGKKYKNCCLRSETRERARMEEHRGAVDRAIGWLELRHPRALREALEAGFFAGLDADHRADLRDLPAELGTMVQINCLEWLLAEGEIEVMRGGSKQRLRASDLVLGPGGPLLLAGQRAYLEEMASSPLRIHEVIESRPGEGLLLRDLLEPARGDVVVREHAGSRSLVQWDVIGARIVRLGDHHELSGAIYSFGDSAREIARRIQQSVAELGASIGASESQRVLSRRIVTSWIEVLTAPRTSPTLVDQGSGDPLMLVTDHYEVLDWDALARRLEAEPDVEGDRREGWTRFVELGDDLRRSLLAINIGKTSNRIEPFARTRRLADDGKAWLERVAGDSIRFLIRDMADPMTLVARGAPLPGSRRRGGEPSRPPLGPEDLTRFHQQMAEKHYRDWADEKIPALGNRTPREAAGTESGRAALVDLLKEYESMEFRRAREEGREPVDFGFLWVSAGLARTRELATP